MAGLDLYYIPTRYPNGLPGGLPADAFGTDHSERAFAQTDRVIVLGAETFTDAGG